MTLFEKIKDVVSMGYDVKFSRDGLHLQIDVIHRNETKTQVLPVSDHFTEDRLVGCIDLLVEKFELDKLSLQINRVLAFSPEKDKRYIEFLEKHQLPNSGPTPELLSSLNKEQRVELMKIIM
jgi:hypothetical protein